MPLDIGRAMAKGTGWTVGTQLSIQAIGMLSMMVLARLLVPADFGLVALATTLSGALQAVSEFSFDVALIQNQSAGRREYDTAWTLSICRNAILAAALAAAARLITSSFGDERLGPVVYWLALGTFFSGFQNIAVVDFRKELAFHRDLVFLVVGKLGPTAVTVPLAFLWRDYWALVAGIVAGSVFRVALSFAMHQYRPRITFARWRELIHFSKWLVLSNLCIFVWSRSSTIILGRILGEHAIGVFSISEEIAGVVTTNLLMPLRRAILPGYAKLASDAERMHDVFIDIFAVLFLASAPLSLGIGVVADPLVRIALGPQWLATIPLIQVLCVADFLRLLTAAASPIYIATGRPHYMMVLYGGGAIATVPLLIYGIAQAGALGAAYAILVVAVLSAALDFFLVNRLLQLTVSRLFAGCWRPIISMTVMVATVAGVQASWPKSQSVGDLILMLGAAVTVGGAVYSLCGFVLWIVAGRPRGAERHLFEAVKIVLKGVSQTLYRVRASQG
ncbi:MAG: lipopolysaccharide biosynthesis protein [Alphaproteobacteria bacterium]|nr:lipopolysaccharide biosynthesis protein [Alphaproteobacteria bacterium]